MTEKDKTLIVSNSIQCLECGDVIFSAHRHDYKECGCGACAVDGGMEYLRIMAAGGARYKELYITLPESVINAGLEALAWAKETGRNDRGALYAVLRALRDGGIDLKVKPLHENK
jgi:hypothetical protein